MSFTHLKDITSLCVQMHKTKARKISLQDVNDKLTIM